MYWLKLQILLFIGYCASQHADCGCKVVEKVDPSESVGVVAKNGSDYVILEIYFEMNDSNSVIVKPLLENSLFDMAT